MIKSYAKINIGLKVLEKRKDGFHDIDSYFHLIDLYDEIYPSATESRCLSVAIEGNAGYLDRGLDIMEKAAIAFSKATGLVFSLDVRIKKRIPSKAGLGGGSSNGAAILKYLNEYFSHPLDEKGLADVALSVGSDLPFFISGLSAARVQGRGELIYPCGLLTGDVDLFLPSFFVETSEAYAKLDTFDRSYVSLPDTLAELTNERFPNDFELVTPRSSVIQSIGSNYSYFSLSGSGSTYFGLCKKDSTWRYKSDNIHTISTILI